MGDPESRTVGRAVRVFISSTFRDMQAERDELVKRVFPELRKLCEQRGVTWGEVDLRWGVTDEQKAEGNVLPICLAEIRRCRPYFIGLLGERYGRVPGHIPRDLLEDQPWLGEDDGCSVTELEILHGVLNNPAMAEHALFYFRSPAYVDSLPEPERDTFREVPAHAETALLGPGAAARRADEREARLLALKQRIRASGFPVREDYPDPRALGELVLTDMRAIIDRVYPEGTKPDALEREAAEHDAFARSRAAVYIGREGYFTRLDAHARSSGLPLVVVGDSGAGKSALLANWAFRYRAARPGELVLMHFIGASPSSADWAAMLRRVMAELQRSLGFEEEIPDEPVALRLAFARWLYMAAHRERVVLIFDALNQLEDRDGAPDLGWLPPEIPAGVRVVLSALPGRPLAELARRGYPVLQVEPLRPAERTELITRYLRQYGRTLSAAHAGRIAQAPQTANPLYLRALLDEMRVWGEHETLGQRIAHYLAAASIDGLYQLILERYEADYERDRPGLVGDAMRTLWAARRGLSETELMDLLGTGGQPLPRAFWSPLYLAAEPALVTRSGLIGFFHDYLRRAVDDRYLPDDNARRAAHLRLAAYFDRQRLSLRAIDELPWHLAETASWLRLRDLLADPSFFEAAWDQDEYGVNHENSGHAVRAFWAQIEANSQYRLADVYGLKPEGYGAAWQALLDKPDFFRLWKVALLLRSVGHRSEAMVIMATLADYFRQAGDSRRLAATLGNQAAFLFESGETSQAAPLFREQERICREIGDLAGLQLALGNQAIALMDEEKLDDALRLAQEQEGICRELGDPSGLARSLGNQANVLRKRGELDGAMRLVRESEQLERELGDVDGLVTSLVNRAGILTERGAYAEAMALLREGERMGRELGNPAALAEVLQGLALIHERQGESGDALAVLLEGEQICRGLADRAGLRRLRLFLGRRASILFDRGDFDAAIAVCREHVRVCREVGDSAPLGGSLYLLAMFLVRAHKIPEALPLIEEAHEIAMSAGLPDLETTVAPLRAVLRRTVGNW